MERSGLPSLRPSGRNFAFLSLSVMRCAKIARGEPNYVRLGLVRFGSAGRNIKPPLADQGATVLRCPAQEQE